MIDRHWIAFYWIASNILNTILIISYFSGKCSDQTVERVFRTRKEVCAGYANLYKYSCDQPCEIVSEYSKYYGFDVYEGAPSETDHGWNAVEIYHHWHLIESTWDTGYLNDRKEFVHDLTLYYFLPRQNEMICHHLLEDKTMAIITNSNKYEAIDANAETSSILFGFIS